MRSSMSIPNLKHDSTFSRKKMTDGPQSENVSPKHTVKSNLKQCSTINKDVKSTLKGKTTGQSRTSHCHKGSTRSGICLPDRTCDGS